MTLMLRPICTIRMSPLIVSNLAKDLRPKTASMTWADPEGGGGWRGPYTPRPPPPPPGKSQMAIGPLKIWYRPLEKQLVPKGQIVSRGRPIRPSVKYLDDLKPCQDTPPPDGFSG